MAVGFRLRVTAGPDRGRTLEVAKLGETPAVIGRGGNPQHDLVCTDAKISRRHAIIQTSPKGFVLVDCKSRNGTRLNGRRLDPEVPSPLKNGDEIGFADETVVRFELLQDEDSTRIEKQIANPSPPPSMPKPEERRPPAARSEVPEPAATRPKPPPVPPAAPPPSPPRPAYARAEPQAREHFGRYGVYETLDESQTDRVDAAVDTRSGDRVALKRYSASVISRKVKSSVLESAARAKRWQHPNIAEVVDAGEQAGTLYVASRLVEGKSLSELQTRFPREFDIPLAAYIAREICAALHYAQDQVSGFVHRNLNPRTIMLGFRGDVVLIDVGFVPVRVAADSTQVLNRMEARHLSPEHLAGRGIDARSDIFSIGVILYELLAQEPIDPRKKAVLADVDTVRPEVPSALAKATMRAIALRPTERFRSSQEMEEELVGVLRQLAPGYGPQAAEWMAKRFQT